MDRNKDHQDSEKVKTQFKESKECSKMMQELKDKMAILRKNQTEILEPKNSLP